MGDMISRIAVLDAVDGVDWYHQNQHGEMVQGANPDEHQAWYKAEDIYSAIKLVPTVDAVNVKHGRWLWRNYPGYQYQCDQCKRWAMYESKFCPECGALMKWWKDGDNG